MFRVIIAVALALPASWATGATVLAASCAQSSVETAISSANDGDTVLVPAGNCSWGGLDIRKGIRLIGAGRGITIITRSGKNVFNKHAVRVTSIDGFSFVNSGGGNASKMWEIMGAPTDRPILVGNNEFRMSTAGMIILHTNGAVIFGNSFTCVAGDESGVQHSAGTSTPALLADWNTPDTLGTRDITGERNVYLEDNTFNNCGAQGVDFDNSSRAVFRYNVMNQSGWNSHGFDTSGVGNRHFEIYGNSFLYKDRNVNLNWQIWIRGGTGVIYNNQIDDINGQMWGDKDEISLSVRSASDGGGQYPGGCCTTWPCIRQLGQNHNGASQFLDPIHFWNNTGSFNVVPHQAWGTCGGPEEEFILLGRDYVMGAARPGYQSYPYPHPLRLGEPVRPAPPSNFSAN